MSVAVMDCDVVLFDLDGTLVDSSDAVFRGWRVWARDVGVSPDDLTDLVLGRSAAEIITTLLPDAGALAVRRHVRDVLTVQEIDPDPARPMAGAARLIGALGAARWAVVTGCSALMAAARLAAGGLPMPELLVADEDVSAGKPHPDGYLLALRRLGVDAAGAVAVEDAPVGVAAAKAAGLRTIAVTTTHPAEVLAAADIVVPTLDGISVAQCGRRLALRVGSGNTA
jgi:sugar-phosphatase